MRMFIFAFPRMRTLRIVYAVFAVATLGLASPAQDQRTNTGAGQAGFHINVVVVPAVTPPHHHPRHRDRDDEAIIYNLDPRQEKLSVTEEVRPMLVYEGPSLARQEQVRIITVVAK